MRVVWAWEDLLALLESLQAPAFWTLIGVFAGVLVFVGVAFWKDR